MKPFKPRTRFPSFWAALCFMIASVALARGDDRLAGIWTFDDGYQILELLFRSDGRYQLDTKNADPSLDLSFTERGRYEINAQSLTLTPYDFISEPQSTHYEFQMADGSLSLTRVEFSQTQVYQLKPGSRADVLAREQADPVLTGTWERTITFYGKEAYTFRPGGYYLLKRTAEDSQFPPEFIRGHYELNDGRITLEPYGGIEVPYELDFFGNTLTLIRNDPYYGEAAAYELIPGSREEVSAKSAEAESFLNRENWQVGVWEIRDAIQTVDLTFRPDGYYIAKQDSEFLGGIVRGRYTLESGRIHLFPFAGQDLYARSNGEFGKVARVRALDYYDGELQFIDLEAISQSVTLARKRPGTGAVVMEKTRQARVEREREGWHIGLWEVHDPTGWMEFTYRPDHRYIVKSGTDGVPGQVERGRYLVSAGKVTLAPYPGQAAPRGFELDLYDGDLFLIGDSARMVIARKVPGSETEVIEKTLHPEALLGERGSILGLWTANLPGQSVELVFRPDGQFRLKRCAYNTLSHDYGLYTVDMDARTLVLDSRFAEVQTHGLDFYGDTLTIFGGHLGPPGTYTVNPGIVDAAIEASLADDAEEAAIDQQWLSRIPIGPRDPNAVQIPTGDIPADPVPGRIFDAPTVLKNYQLYRRLIPGFVYFNHQGTIKSVAVVHTREWHFFPTGRVLVRFKNHHAGVVYPATVTDVSDSWGAYHVGPKPDQLDILHIYADNALWIDTDLGEQVEMTLEDGRRNLFWNKDYQILSEWAAERTPIPCQLPEADARLMNTGVSLSTEIEPEPIGGLQPMRLTLTGPVSGNFAMSGTTDGAGTLVVERTTSLASPIVWESWQTNSVPGGAFSFLIPQGTNPVAYFRVRGQ